MDTNGLQWNPMDSDKLQCPFDRPDRPLSHPIDPGVQRLTKKCIGAQEPDGPTGFHCTPMEAIGG
eukprot:11171229-Lingulodinium_polyedra.AAC.1